MDKAKQKFFNDYLEVITFFVFILILLVIYIPSLIWEEEDMYKEESRFRMQTVYNVENFHNILTGSYETDGKKAVTLVNAVRDSVMADSTFLGEQIVKLNGEEFLVDVPKGFDVEYDTTFGLRRISKETIVDTTVTVLMMSEETGLEDTVYVQKKNLFDAQQDPLFMGIVEENTFERVETVSYFDRRFRKETNPYNFAFLPDDTQFFCPLTGDPYIIEINDEGNSVRVSSPIRSYRDNRYGFFAKKPYLLSRYERIGLETLTEFPSSLISIIYGSPVRGQKNCVSSGKNAKLYGLVSFLNLLSK